MNQLATQNERLPMDSVGMSTGATGAKIAPQNLGELVKFAEVMCRADIALPKHLRGNAGACMAVALQALEWQMSPFAVASKSYAVNGAIAYEAQLIAAVVNTRSGIKGRLKYRFDGEGNAMTCTVTGILDGDECAYTSPPIGSITTKNSPLWKTDPQQQLGYYSSRSWARRYCPEVILGVYDRDEAEEFRGPDRAKNITPVFDPLSDEPVAAQEGHGALDRVSTTDMAHEPFDASTGEILDNTDTGSSTEPAADDLIASGSSAQDGEVSNPASPSTHSEWLVNVARMLWAATNFNGDLNILKAQKLAALASYPKPEACPAVVTGKAETVYAYCKQIVEGSLEPADGLAMVAGAVGCDQDDLIGGAA